MRAVSGNGPEQRGLVAQRKPRMLRRQHGKRKALTAAARSGGGPAELRTAAIPRPVGERLLRLARLRLLRWRVFPWGVRAPTERRPEQQRAERDRSPHRVLHDDLLIARGLTQRFHSGVSSGKRGGTSSCTLRRSTR